jgi:hypothetical protein
VDVVRCRENVETSTSAGNVFLGPSCEEKEKEFVASTVLVSCKKGVEVLEGG